MLNARLPGVRAGARTVVTSAAGALDVKVDLAQPDSGRDDSGSGSKRNANESCTGSMFFGRIQFRFHLLTAGHARMPKFRTWDDDPPNGEDPHPSRQSFGTTRRIRTKCGPEATWAQPLIREELS